MNPFEKIKFMVLAAAIICPTFTACDNNADDDIIETDATSAATYVAGTFSGDCKTVVYTATIDETQEFTITMQEDGTFTLTTPSITYTQMGTTIPSFTVSGTKAEQTTLNDVTIYQLSATNYAGEVEVDGSTKTYTVSQLSIAISKADSTAAINYTFNYGKMPFPVEVSFAGKKN